MSEKFSHTHTQWLPKADVTVSILRILGPILGAVLNFKLTYEVRSANMNAKYLLHLYMKYLRIEEDIFPPINNSMKPYLAN